MKGRLVDLSHTLRPGLEKRLLEIERLQANQVANVPLLPGQWYIMHNVRMVTHSGTHIECPYHINRDGADTASVPLERLVGEAVVLDLRGMEPGAEISLGQIRSAVEKAGGFQRGDFVLFHTGWDQYYGTPAYSVPSQEGFQGLLSQLLAMEDHVSSERWLSGKAELRGPPVQQRLGQPFTDLRQSRLVTLHRVAFPRG